MDRKVVNFEFVRPDRLPMFSASGFYDLINFVNSAPLIRRGSQFFMLET